MTTLTDFRKTVETGVDPRLPPLPPPPPNSPNGVLLAPNKGVPPPANANPEKVEPVFDPE